MSRAISVDVPSGSLRVISVEDALAHEARFLLDLDANVPVPAKRADDYLRLAELVKSSNMETAWQDHRKPTHPMTFGETNALLKRLIATRHNLLISPDYSKDTAEICLRCEPTTPFQLVDPNVVLSLPWILLSLFDVEPPRRTYTPYGRSLNYGQFFHNPVRGMVPDTTSFTRGAKNEACYAQPALPCALASELQRVNYVTDSRSDDSCPGC